MARASIVTRSSSVPRPPGLHWTLVLLLSVVTVGLFLDIWIIVQAVWVKKLDETNMALSLSIAGIALSVVEGILDVMKAGVNVELPVLLAGVVVSVVAAFKIRDALAQYITDSKHRQTYLSGLMTILLGPVYLQYHMNQVRSYLRHAAPATA